MPLKDLLYKRKLKQSLRNTHKDLADTFVNSCKQIGILFELDHENTEDQIQQFCKPLLKKGHQTYMFTFLSNKNKLEEEHIFTNADFNWFGWPNAEKLNEFIETSFDVLIVLNPNALKNIETLSILSKATFKIGTNPNQLDHFQLIIDSKDKKDTKSVLKDLNHSISKIAL